MSDILKKKKKELVFRCNCGIYSSSFIEIIQIQATGQKALIYSWYIYIYHQIWVFHLCPKSERIKQLCQSQVIPLQSTLKYFGFFIIKYMHVSDYRCFLSWLAMGCQPELRLTSKDRDYWFVYGALVFTYFPFPIFGFYLPISPEGLIPHISYPQRGLGKRICFVYN